MILQSCLLLVLAIFGYLSTTKDFADSNNLRKLYRYKSYQITKKKALKFGIIILIVVVFVLQVFNLITQIRSDEEKQTLQVKLRDTMLVSFQRSIKQANSVLKQTGTIYKAVTNAQKIINKQLLLQDSVTKSAKKLLEENRQITIALSETYNNINRLSNPLFPIDIELGFEISLNNPRIKQIARKIKQIKENYSKGITPPRGVTFWFKPDEKEIHDIDINPDSLFADEEYLEYQSLLYHQISILYHPYKKFNYRDSVDAQVNFEIPTTMKFFKTMQVNFVENKIYLDITCPKIEFKNSPRLQSTAILGFSDLNKSYISLDRTQCDNDFSIKRISISTHKGLQKHLSLFVSKKDFIISKGGCKIFFHKILETEFTYKQKPIVPKYE
jgi:hypothetical protein